MSSPQLTVESSAVQKYLDILQSVISRMAGNSSNCKSVCITLVSAIVVVIADKGKPDFAWITLIPVILFCLLDAYYLGLEQGFRNTYNEFVKKLQNGVATPKDLFLIMPKRIVKKRQADGLTTLEIKAFSPVYGTVLPDADCGAAAGSFFSF
jgi:carbon starvation protein CstA